MANSFNSSSGSRLLPSFVPPKNYAKIARPDSQGKWSELEALIKPYVEGFAVIDEATKHALAEITSYRGLMNPDFAESYFTGPIDQNIDLFKKVASLGLDFGYNKLKYSCAPQKLLCAHPRLMAFLPIIMKLRINVDYSTLTCPQAAKYWCDQLQANGKPVEASIAQLACEGDFYAVFYHLRQPNSYVLLEISQIHRGRNVLEWALHHRQECLAQELLFRYPSLKPTPIPPPAPVVAPSPAQQPPQDATGRLQKKVDALEKENESLKEEMKLLKESVTLGFQKMQQEMSGAQKKINKKVSQQLQEMEGGLKKKYLTRKGFKFYRDMLVDLRDKLNMAESDDDEKVEDVEIDE